MSFPLRAKKLSFWIKDSLKYCFIKYSFQSCQRLVKNNHQSFYVTCLFGGNANILCICLKLTCVVNFIHLELDLLEILYVSNFMSFKLYKFELHMFRASYPSNFFLHCIICMYTQGNMQKKLEDIQSLYPIVLFVFWRKWRKTFF